MLLWLVPLIAAPVLGNRVICWGTSSKVEPPADLDHEAVDFIYGGEYNTCALMTGGTVQCWGKSYTGINSVPSDLANVATVDLRVRHACALLHSKELRCWGSPSIAGVLDVPSGGLWSSFTVGEGVTCGVNASDSLVVCWGAGYDNNRHGELDVPANLGGVRSVFAGFHHICAVRLTGYVLCWGGSYSGQARLPSSLGKVVRGFAYAATNIVIQENGLSKSWGNGGYNQDDDSSGHYLSVISVANFHVCGANLQGIVTCWGYDGAGALEVPPDLGPVKALALNNYYSCALRNFSITTTTSSTSTWTSSSSTVTSTSSSTVTTTVTSTASTTTGTTATGTTTTGTTTATSTTVTSSATTSSTTTTGTSSTSTSSTSTSSTSASSTSTSSTSTRTSSTSTTVTRSTTGTTSTTTTGTSTTVTSSTTSATSSTTSSETSTETSTVTSTVTTTVTSSVTSTVTSTMTSTVTSVTSSLTTSRTSTGTSTLTMIQTGTTSSSATSATSTEMSSTLRSTSGTDTESSTIDTTLETDTSRETWATTTATSSGSATSPSTGPSTSWTVAEGMAEAEHMDAVRAAAPVLLGQLRAGLASAVQAQQGIMVSGFRLGELAANVTEEGYVQLAADVGAAGGVSISFPSKLLAALPASSVEGDEPVVLVSPSSAAAMGVGNAFAGRAVRAAVALDLLYLKSGEEIGVRDLQEPVFFTMPNANYSAGMTCGFFNTSLSQWTLEGTGAASRNVVGEPLACFTYHFSLFGAIASAFVETFQCAQLHLFSAEAVQVLLEGRWLLSPISLIFWAMLALSVLLLLAAIACDLGCGRMAWKDEYLLMQASGGEEEPQALSQQEEEVELEAIVAGSCIFSCLSIGCATLGRARHSACREALDDVVSNLFEHFADLRTLLEGLCQGLGRPFLEKTEQAMCFCMLLVARKRAAARMGVSEELVRFVMEDEGLRQHLTENFDRGVPGAKAAGAWRSQTEGEEFWEHLNSEIGETVRSGLRLQGRWCELPSTLWQIFLLHCPLFEGFHDDIFSRHGIRVFLVNVEVLSALVLAAAFFQASGRGRAGRSSCSSEEEHLQVTYSLGRVLAVGLGSTVVAGLPVALLQSLQTREFKRVADKKGADGQRQLRAWQIQDGLVWGVGAAYFSFGLFFTALFLSNVGAEDELEYTRAVLVALAQDFVIMPLSLGLLTPVLANGLLAFQSSFGGLSRAELLRRAQHRLLDGSNANMPVGMI